MKKTQSTVVALMLLVMGISCSQGHKGMKEESGYSDVSEISVESVSDANLDVSNIQSSDIDKSQGYTSSAAALDNARFGDRKFIRTSEMKFKVDNVIDATYKIEDITVQNGGFVEKSEIKNTGERTTFVDVSADSTQLITQYTLESYLRIRVPAQSLDSTLKAIAPLVGKMDYRVVEANDVSLSLLSDKLKQKRESVYSKRIENAVDAQSRKLNDVVDAEQSRKGAEESGDNAYLSSLSLKDRIEFSSVVIRMYQKEASRTEYVARMKKVEVYEPPFTEKMKDAFVFGCNVLANIVLFLTHIWVFILIAIVGYIIYRKYKKNKS